jgi:hypothetical protein
MSEAIILLRLYTFMPYIAKPLPYLFNKFSTPSICQAQLCRLLKWSANKELQNMWKDDALFRFECVSRNLSGVPEDKN